jgi:CheY-like chemotaxis protein
MNILIADDELRLRKVVAMFLKKSGHEVKEAATGEQALETLKSERADVVVLDVVMPGIGGIETCRRIKQDPSLNSIPVILLTANVSAEDRELGLNAGAQAYVTKPFSPKDLLEKIIETSALNKPI